MPQGAGREILTRRLSLVALGPADAAAVLSGARSAAWAAGYPTPGDVEVARWVSAGRFAPRDPRFGPRRIIVSDPGLVIGGVGFHGAPRDGVVEIGYGIAPEWRGQGLGSEVVMAFVAYAFTLAGVRRVTAVADPANVASRRALERAGLVIDGPAEGALRFARDRALR